MARSKWGRIIAIGLASILAVVIFGRSFSYLFTEVLWFRSVGYSSVFRTQILWNWGGKLLVGLIAGLGVYFNLRLVGSTVGVLHIRRRFGNLEISERLPKGYITLAVVLTSLLVALWFGAGSPSNFGLQLLYLLNSPEWGTVDPILGADISFYVFALPLLTASITLSLVLVFLLGGLCGIGYAATGALRVGKGVLEIDRRPRLHLSILLTVAFLLLAIRFWIAPALLLLDGNSGVQSIFGFADANARIPGLKILAGLSLALAGLALWSGIRARKTALIAGLASYVLAILVLTELYPTLVQRFQVEPNELAAETPFIEHNLSFTRGAFGLQELDRFSFDYSAPTEADWLEAPPQFQGLPVWSTSALLTTFRELEARFQYYDFARVSVDRYPTGQGPVPVALSVREIDPTGIDDPNWQNLHLRERYLSGVGAVSSLVTQKNPEGRPRMVLSAIPPEYTAGPDVPEDLQLEAPSVFFGSTPQLYAIINPTEEAFTAPGGGLGTPGVDFPEGITLSSLIKTLAFAWRFGDANLLFASEITNSSRFVFRRRVTERVQSIAPFLEFNEAPYPVVHRGRIVWILDGFTTTRVFPLSTPHDLRPRRLPVSYLRNSVKVTVDAVTGDVKLYRIDTEDPLLKTFDRSFPGLIKPFEEMPADLQAHIRYPKSLLDLQANVLLRYHQETAPLFHGQQDVWAPAQEQAQGTSPVPYEPEYGLFRLPEDTEPSFLLSTVFVPAGRQNLTGLLVARSDPEQYGELVLYDFPIQDQIPGPRQVEALIEQDPTISQQFSLWRQGGSEVWTGHLHLVPVGSSLLYMEPVFLAAEADAIPELTQFVVSDGRSVSMGPTLTGALAALVRLSGLGEQPVFEEISAVGERGNTERGELESLPQEALELLDQADRAIRVGDWQGFGEALEALRRLLESMTRGS